MKKILSLVLALCMLCGMCAFASAEEALEPVELTIMFHGSNVADDKAVLEKVNEYLGEKINAKLNVIWGTWGDFDETSTMSLNAGDPVDMYFTCSWSQDEYNAYAKRGMWVRLDDPENNLIEKYAADLWATLPEVLTNGAAIEGSDGYGVYAVPGYKDIATQNCWDINVDLLEKYGYTLDDIKNTDFYGFGDILAKVKAGEGDSFYPLLVEPMVLERMVTNSIIVAGDSGAVNLLSYYLNPEDVALEGPYGDVMLNKFATDEYKKFVEKVREYYLAGYIDPTLAVQETSNDTRMNKQLTGQYLIGTQSYALGYEFQASQERKIHVEMVPCTPAYVDTTSSQGAMVAISTASQNPERAMMFLNLLNTDPTLLTLLNYGVEGVHYALDRLGDIHLIGRHPQPQRPARLIPPHEVALHALAHRMTDHGILYRPVIDQNPQPRRTGRRHLRRAQSCSSLIERCAVRPRSCISAASTVNPRSTGAVSTYRCRASALRVPLP